MNPGQIYITATGTGGHILPAKFIGEAILEKIPTATISFIGTGRPLEAKLLTGHRLLTVQSSGIVGKGIFGVLRFFIMLPRAIFQLCKIYLAQRPILVVGVGGYGSVLPILVGKIFGAKTAIHEAEVVPGAANRFLSHFVDVITVAHPKAQISGHQVVFTGHPVKPEIAKIAQKIVKRSHTSNIKNLLIIGGSLGADAIDRAFIELAPKLTFNIIHQCRAENLAALQAAYGAAGLTATVVPFIDDMIGAYSWADYIVARAGAGTVAEIALLGTPTVFIPLKSKSNHQEANADILVERGQAMVVHEPITAPYTSLLEALDRVRELPVIGISGVATLPQALISEQLLLLSC